MTSTIINLITALVLATCALKHRRKPFYVVFILFIYISLHYAYSIIAVIGLSYVPAKPADSEFGPKIIGVGFLLFIAGLLIFKRAGKVLIAIGLRPFKKIIFFFYNYFISHDPESLNDTKFTKVSNGKDKISSL